MRRKQQEQEQEQKIAGLQVSGWVAGEGRAGEMWLMGAVWGGCRGGRYHARLNVSTTHAAPPAPAFHPLPSSHPFSVFVYPTCLPAPPGGVVCGWPVG